MREPVLHSPLLAPSSLAGSTFRLLATNDSAHRQQCRPQTRTSLAQSTRFCTYSGGPTRRTPKACNSPASSSYSSASMSNGSQPAAHPSVMLAGAEYTVQDDEWRDQPERQQVRVMRDPAVRVIRCRVRQFVLVSPPSCLANPAAMLRTRSTT